MTDQTFVLLDNWQNICHNLEELTDTLADLSSRPCVAYTLLEALKQVAQQEGDEWSKIGLFFGSREEAQIAYAEECERRTIKL